MASNDYEVIYNIFFQEQKKWNLKKKIIKVFSI